EQEEQVRQQEKDMPEDMVLMLRGKDLLGRLEDQ
mgnify:CR=1